MRNYTIVVDSACDIAQDILAKNGIKCVNITYRFDGDEVEYNDAMLPAEQFYARLRAGELAKTAAVNVEAFKTAFKEELEAGNDVFYLGFSSGLSSTYNSGRLAAAELEGDFSDAKIITVDSLCGSAGYGLLLYLVNREKEKGASIDAAAAYAEKMRLRICHWFTVDTFEFLKKGGRISAATAIIGGLLNIKPILHVDNEGRLAAVAKVRGRIAAIEALAKRLAERAAELDKFPIFISHADCKADAERLASKIKDLCGKAVTLITDVGSSVGAHGGPGSLALFFVGNER